MLRGLRGVQNGQRTVLPPDDTCDPHFDPEVVKLAPELGTWGEGPEATGPSAGDADKGAGGGDVAKAGD